MVLTGILLYSCSTSPEKQEEAFMQWDGLNVSEIEKHPYFKYLPRKIIKNKSGIDTWIYRDQTPYPTDAYCQSLGGCLGRPSYRCLNAFSVKDNIILDFDQEGTCPGINTIRPK